MNGRRLRGWGGILLAWAWLCLGAATGQEAIGQAVAGASTEGPITTEITSDQLTFDYDKRYAVFEGNVVVTDPRLGIQSDVLTVQFDEDDSARWVVARGNVVFTRDDKVCTCERADYDVQAGKIVLTGQPAVRRGTDLLSGQRIIFLVQENRMIVEGGGTLRLTPEEGSGESWNPFLQGGAGQ